MRRAGLALAALLLALPACRDDENATLLIVVTASGSPPTVSALEVTLRGSAGMSSRRYDHDGNEPISFPTTLSAQLPTYATGALSIDIEARDAADETVASGHGDVTIRPGQRETAFVQLDCQGAVCVVDGGVVDPDGGMPTPGPRCGNGRVDPGETCDTKIVAGAPGACPPLSCDDHVACTRDRPVGADCTLTCKHEMIDQVVAGDGCCPAGVTAADGDTDCSASCGNGVVDPGETCDTKIGRDQPGACPTNCPPGAACAESHLVSAGTCSATCVSYQIVTQSGKQSDGCCPPGATNAVDTDCSPTCGNGVVDDGEKCDVGISRVSENACPASCDDGKPWTIDFFLTTGCQPACINWEITAPVSGDGYCPPGFSQAQDTDCAPKCGNGVVERGEACDPPSSCPTGCPLPPGQALRAGKPLLGCLRGEVVGSADDCTAHCELYEISACDLQTPDECCPTGCTDKTDADCSARCGNTFRDVTFGEECDIAADPMGGAAGVCPTSCPKNPKDPNPCHASRLVSVGTCSARCVPLLITAFVAGDGCCPNGGNFAVDPDCASECGNGVVEAPAERCDYGVTCTGPSCSCPQVCPPSAFCTRYVLQGTAENCSAACIATQITDCVAGDGCCPPGCSTANDPDCMPTCGNGVVEGLESCDRGITPGHQGACAASCDDGNACTLDFASGSTEGCTRACINQVITACVGNDGCCPAGCSAATDSDCDARCGDGKIGAGETCDPRATCPTFCPDDGDPCTAEQLTGSAETCNVACRHLPIIACSGAASDSCCPTGCNPTDDWDCL